MKALLPPSSSVLVAWRYGHQRVSFQGIYSASGAVKLKTNPGQPIVLALSHFPWLAPLRLIRRRGRIVAVLDDVSSFVVVVVTPRERLYRFACFASRVLSPRWRPGIILKLRRSRLFQSLDYPLILIWRFPTYQPPVLSPFIKTGDETSGYFLLTAKLERLLLLFSETGCRCPSALVIASLEICWLSSAMPVLCRCAAAAWLTKSRR